MAVTSRTGVICRALVRALVLGPALYAAAAGCGGSKNAGVGAPASGTGGSTPINTDGTGGGGGAGAPDAAAFHAELVSARSGA